MAGLLFILSTIALQATLVQSETIPDGFDSLNGEFKVCKWIVDTAHERIGQDRSQESILNHISDVRGALPENLRSVCDNFLGVHKEEVVSLLQVTEKTSWPDLGAAAEDDPALAAALSQKKAIDAGDAAFGLNQVPIPVTKPDPSEMKEFWKSKGQYCSACLGITHRLTRYLDQNTTRASMLDRLNRLCLFMPGGLSEACQSNLGIWGEYTIDQFLTIERLPHLCLRAGLCEATVIVNTKTDAMSERGVPMVNYNQEPVLVAPSSHQKPLIFFPNKKDGLPYVKFIPKKQYDREPEVTLNRNEIYEPSLIKKSLDKSLAHDRSMMDADAQYGMKVDPSNEVSSLSISDSDLIKPVLPWQQNGASSSSFAQADISKLTSSFLQTAQVGEDDEPSVPTDDLPISTDNWKASSGRFPPGFYHTATTPGGSKMFDIPAPASSGPDEKEVRIAPASFDDPMVELHAGTGARFGSNPDNVPVFHVNGDPDAKGCQDGDSKVGGSGPCLPSDMHAAGGAGPAMGAFAVAPNGGVAEMDFAYRGKTPSIFLKGCSTCQFMMNSMDEFMRHSRTLRVVIPTIKAMCDKCSTPEEHRRCIELVDKHGYRMYEIFVNRGKAKSFCPKLDLCEENYFGPSPYHLAHNYYRWRKANKKTFFKTPTSA